MMKLSDLLKNILPISVKEDVTITGLALDSRLVKPGNLFFACAGTHLDGREFIEDAINNGACVILTEGEVPAHTKIPIFSIPHLQQKMGEIAAHFFHSPSKKMQMIGITGTNGKTSCSHFIASALEQVSIPCGVIGTLGNGLIDDIQPTLLTTPDAITLQKTLAELLEKGAKAVAMEVSSHSLSQFRVSGIRFEIGVFTNLTHDHLDYHGSMEDYAAAKKKLFHDSRSKYAVVNADDPFGKTLIESGLNHRVFAYSLNETIALPDAIPLVTASQMHLDLTGIHARVKTPWGEGDLQVPLIGEFNLSNMLAVLTVLCLLRIPLPLALNSLKQVKSVPGRMQRVGGGDKPLIIVDYAHTPDALEKVLMALRQHCQGKLYCLFGCGGDRDRSKRPLMASIAEKQADVVMVTDDNPRTESPEKIVADILKGFREPQKVMVQHDRSKAIANIIQYATKGDCVLIAGKGAEMYQHIGNEKIPFSDVEKVKGSLHARMAQ